MKDGGVMQLDRKHWENVLAYLNQADDRSILEALRHSRPLLQRLTRLLVQAATPGNDGDNDAIRA
jgi:hypothetical protein